MAKNKRFLHTFADVFDTCWYIIVRSALKMLNKFPKQSPVFCAYENSEWYCSYYNVSLDWMVQWILSHAFLFYLLIIPFNNFLSYLLFCSYDYCEWYYSYYNVSLDYTAQGLLIFSHAYLFEFLIIPFNAIFLSLGSFCR